MRSSLVSGTFLLICAFASGASSQEARPANPAPTGAAIPSDVKTPPPPHKAFDFTVYGRVNVSFDLGTGTSPQAFSLGMTYDF
jgi:hypothetical protein